MLAALTEGLEAVHGADLLHPGHQAGERDGEAGRDAGADRLRVGAAGDRGPLEVTDGGADAGVCADRAVQRAGAPGTVDGHLRAGSGGVLGAERRGAGGSDRGGCVGTRLLPVAQAARVRVSARLAAAVDAALTVNEAERPQSLQEWRAMLERGAMKPPPAGEEEATGSAAKGSGPRGAAGDRRGALRAGDGRAEEAVGRGGGSRTGGRGTGGGVDSSRGTDSDVSTVQEEEPVEIAELGEIVEEPIDPAPAPDPASLAAEIDPTPDPAPAPVPEPVPPLAAAEQAAAVCEEWNTEEFFQTATLEQLTACLEAGRDVNALGETTPRPA